VSPWGKSGPAALAQQGALGNGKIVEGLGRRRIWGGRTNKEGSSRKKDSQITGEKIVKVGWLRRK